MSQSSRRRAAVLAAATVLAVTVAPAAARASAVPPASAADGPGVLEVNQVSVPSGLRPGDDAGLPITVTNTGGQAVTGVDLTVRHSTGLRPPEHANCAETGADTYTCRFDSVIAPGATYRLASPLAVRLADDALFESVVYRAAPAGTAALLAGSGPALTLVATDPESGRTSASMNESIDADSTADLAAGGTAATGKSGDEVSVTASVHNNGPGWLDYAEGDGWEDVQFGVMVTVPAGTTAVGVPKGCVAWSVFQQSGLGFDTPPTPGAPQYICGGRRLGAGESADFPLTLRIGAHTTGTVTGAVKATLANPSLGLPFDHTPGNDQAELTVHVTSPATGSTGGDGGTGSTGGTGGTTGGDTGGTADSGTSGGNATAPQTTGAGTGGVLAATGAGPAPLAAGAAAVLLGGGAMLLAATRRRRTQ